MTTAGLVFALLLADAPAVAPASDGLITFGTKSEAAASAAREALTLMTRPPRNLRAIAQRAVDADPDFALAHQLLAVGFGVENEREAMEVQLARARELAPKAPAGERRLIEAWQMTRDQPDEAIAAWTAFTKDYPREPLGPLSLGRLYATRFAKSANPADLSQAKASLQSVLDLEPESPLARTVLLDTLLQADDFAGVRHLLEKTNPSDRAAPQIAVSYLLEGQPEQCRSVLKQHVEKNDAALGVAGWNFAAHLMLEAGDAATALQWYTRGVEAMKASDRAEQEKRVWLGRYHHGRGRCLARLGKPAEARVEVDTVKKMIDDGGDDGTRYLPAWHFLAGYVTLEAGDNKAALAHLKEAGPQHDPHRTQLMGLASERLGDKAEARRYYEDVVAKKRLTIDGAAAYGPAKAGLARLLEQEAKR